MSGQPTTNGKPVNPSLRLATPRQLWRLNSEGALRIDVSDALFLPGAEAPNAPVSNQEAKLLIGRLLSERWPGLGFPKAGEAWTVRDGLVVPLRSGAG